MLVLGAGVVGGVSVGIAAPGKVISKTLLGGCALVLFVATWFAGAHAFNHAFNECVHRGEDVRVLLTRHYQERGEYPIELDALEAPIPCGRITRPSVLVYEKTADGYELSFADWLVEHTATESEPFMAHK